MAGGTVVSVIIPTRNSAAFLPDALASLAGQTAAEYEVVVIDGASTDSTITVVEQYRSRLPLHWVSEPDAGQADAINKGFRMARGEVVSWLNADDTLARGALARVAAAFDSDPSLEMLSGLGILADPAGGFLKVIPETPIQRIEDLYRFGCHICQPSTFLRRRVLERNGPLDVSYQFAMDFEYWLRIGRNVRFRFVPEILSSFRVHPDSKSVRQQARFWAEEKRAFRSHGGTWRSPLYLAHFHSTKVIWTAYLLMAPVRRVLWRLFRLSPGEWLRPGPPPTMTAQAAPPTAVQDPHDTQ